MRNLFLEMLNKHSRPASTHFIHHSLQIRPFWRQTELLIFPFTSHRFSLFLTLSHPLLVSHSLTLSHTLSLSISHFLSLSHTLSVSLLLTPSSFLSFHLFDTLPLPLSYTHFSLSCSLMNTLFPHSLTLTPSVFLSFTISLFLSL